MAKIAILVGSERKGGNTDLLATAFREGAAQENEVTVLSVAELKVNPCTGCNACRNKSMERNCCQTDDMEKVFDVLSRTDILVIASPVYFYGLSAQLKAVIDRLHTPKRKQLHIKKLGLLLVAADTIPQVFDAIKIQYQLTRDYFGLESIGEICVGGVEEKGEIKGNDALEKARELGKSIETLQRY